MPRRKLLKSIFNKEELQNMDYIKFILNASSSSAKFGHITLNEGEKNFRTRGNINAMMIMPFGTGKTSSIADIPNAYEANDISFPGMIGSITKDGDLLKGTAVRAAAENKVLVIDEAQKIPRRVKDGMNSVLEYPHRYSRSLGFKLNQYTDSYLTDKSKYYRIVGSENEIRVYAKFSCIASAMYMKMNTDTEKAWASRFLHARVIADTSFLKNLSRGKASIEISPNEFKSDFVFDDYLKFVDYYWDTFDKSKFPLVFKTRESEIGFVMRNLMDMVRLSAYLASMEERSEITLEDSKLIVDKFFNISMYNTLVSPLSMADYTILNNYYLSYEELVKFPEIEGMTRQLVHIKKKDLVRKGLVKELQSDKVLFNDSSITLE